MIGAGNGTFTAGQRVAVGIGPTSIAVADLNGDGHADLVTANRTSNDVSILLGRGNGIF
ncbi:MAG: hypothetical protein ETSY2_14765 [Candidatus Entotheonella gemina]|uniref:VCBS repeat-containing protein n=1 Tax=Candidatus Entotheonella gemina TaxID=1429439 RepID=W4M9F8_9BACT|nr:MAG: hypothetical protein ETSY2_14765 [Candidatus Entotheonella gemina]